MGMGLNPSATPASSASVPAATPTTTTTAPAAGGSTTSGTAAPPTQPQQQQYGSFLANLIQQLAANSLVSFFICNFGGFV